MTRHARFDADRPDGTKNRAEPVSSPGSHTGVTNQLGEQGLAIDQFDH